jgi:hypothetical protein
MAPLSKPLILSAAHFEAAHLLKLLSQNGVAFDYDCFGVGSIEAAWRARDLARLATGRAVIVLGSVGVFWDFSQMVIVRSGIVHWKPTCVVEKSAALIEGMELPWNSLGKPYFTPVEQAGDIFTSPGITISQPTFKSQHTFENLELYSLRPIYEAAQSFDTFFCVTNEVGPKGRAQWKENFVSGAELCGNLVFRRLLGKN